MQFPLDADLTVFVYTVGTILFGGIRRLRRNAHKIPIHYQIEQLSPAALTEAQANYLAPFDEKLAAMNYLPVCTYRVVNYGHNLLRNYVNPLETSRCVVMIHELALRQSGRPSVANVCLMSFHTRFTDATILTTRNMHLSMMDRPRYHKVQEFVGITEPEELKRKHDCQAAGMGCPVPPPSDAAGTFKDVQDEHLRFNKYQLSTGALQLASDGNSYTLTDRVFWRGIRKHLNPFEHRFSMRSFLPAVFGSIALPVFAVTKLAPAADEAARNIGFPPHAAGEAVTLACYLVAGALIGYALERKTFVWVFLLTYLAVRILTGAHLGPLPYSAFAGSVAYSVAQTKKRRRAVLLPNRVY